MLKKFLFLLTFCCTLVMLKAQEIISTEYLDHYTASDMTSDFGLPAFLVKNGVYLYKMTYTTPDVNGVSSTASGLVCVPDINASYPLLCYGHGTVSDRDNVPSNIEGDPIGLIFCAFGYVTASPDLLGLGDSPGIHTYVHAATTASASLDMMRATRTFMSEDEYNQESLVNDQVFLTGYSQGGFSAMATHRAMELDFPDEFQVTASAPMSGPYSISGAMRDLMFSEEEYFFVAYLPNTFLSYNHAYGLGYEASDFFKPEYAAMIDQFANEEIDLGELNEMLIQALTTNEGGSYPSALFVDGLAEELQTNEDHPLNVALRDNDVYDWAPNAPTRIYYCTADDQVPYHNAIIADTTMNNNGAADLFATDVNTNADHGGCVTPAVTSTTLFFANYQDIDLIIENATTEIQHQKATFTAIPNPAKGAFIIQFLDDTDSNPKAYLYNDVGQIVLEKTISTSDNQLNISNLSKGLYFLRVNTDGKYWTEKVLID